jgi:2-keto-4-pentenoate hydratase/2-oxohepta-3-ene-1,7-dioic acid hydratase in catechol pathway
MAWSLVNIVNSAGHEQAAAMDSHSVTVAIDVLPHGMTLIELVRRWEEFREVLSAWNPAGAQPVNGRVVQPLRFTSKLICIGANYRDHRQEMAATSDAPKANPFFFLKPPTTALIGPGDDILIRSEEDRVELGG